MTEFNPNEYEPIDAQYETKQPKTYAKKKKKTKKSHPVLTVLLCGLVSVAGGVGGGYAAFRHFTSTAAATTSSGTAYSYSTETPTSTTTNVSSNSSGLGLTTAEVAAKAAPSVVEIVTEITQTTYGMFGGTYTSEAAGSGVIISTDGYIVTNNHVIEDATSIKVTTFDGKSYDATLVGTDAKTDIAVIKVQADDLHAATIGDSSVLSAGDTAVVIGNPLGTLGGTVTDGIISAVSREIVINNEAMELIQTNAEINSGNSGGGMFDGNGNLIGIVNAKDSGTTSSGTTIEGIGFAIPVNKAMEVADQLIQYGKVTNRPTLGIYLQEVTNTTGRYEAGLYITQIIAGSGAEEAGLQAYDRIVSADGTNVSSYSDLSTILNKKKVGDTIILTISRDGRTMDVTVTLTGVIEENNETGSIYSNSTLG